MRRSLYIIASILFAAVAVCLTSCKDTEADPDPEKQPSIYGMWVFANEILQKYTINPETGEEEILYDYFYEEDEGCREFWDFKKNNNNDSGILSIASTPFSEVLYLFDYDESKKQITFEPGDPDYEIVYKVTNLTLKEMTLYYDIWDDKENYGERHRVELWKWWTDF